MAGAVLALAASPAHARPPASWLTYGFGPMRGGYNGAETRVGPTNAGRIHRVWADQLSGRDDRPAGGGCRRANPRRGNRCALRGTEAGDLYAIRAADGHLIWHRNLGSVVTTCLDVPAGNFGIGGAGAISFTSPGAGVIYVAGGDGAVHALDLATGAERPGWPVRGVFTPADEAVYGGLNLSEGRLYMAIAGHCDQAPYYGGVAEISVVKHAVVNRFYPAGRPSGGISGGGVWGPGGVSVDPVTKEVFAATGNALTTPENHGFSDAVVGLNQSLAVIDYSAPSLVGNDVDFGTTPVLFRPAGCPTELLAVKNKTGALFIYSTRDIHSGPSQRLQIANPRQRGFNGVPAWDPATGMLYVTNPSDSGGVFRHGVVALRAAPNCQLSLAWQRSVGPIRGSMSPPTVANGVVYYGDGPGEREFAFNAATGKRLWSSSSTVNGGALYAAPTVVNGTLLVPSFGGYLYAFGLDRARG